MHPSLCGLRLVAEILALAVEVFGVRGRDKAQKRLRELLVNTPVLGFPRGSVGKESSCSVGDLGLIPGLGRSPGGGKGHLLQYSGLENSMDCKVHGVAKSQTRRSDFCFTSLPPFPPSS